MKIFHLSDLHIGLKLMNRDLTEDQIHIFRQIAEAAKMEKPDAIVIAGDLYDRAVPSAEAVELFDRFVLMLVEAAPEAEIMMISGNHDSAPRVNVFRQVLDRQRIHMIGLPPMLPGDRIEKVTLKDDYGPVHFYLLPFVKPSVVRPLVGSDADGNLLSYDETLHRLIGLEELNPAERNVLVSHQFYLPVGTDAEDIPRMDSEVRTVGNIDEVRADVLAPFDYAALGHIHKPMTVGSDRYRYCGTPLACSVSETGQQKAILVVELGEKADREENAGVDDQNTGLAAVQISEIPLTPLRPVRVIRGTLTEVLRQGSDDYVSVVLTDEKDLDLFDMQDRVRGAFPNVLEIRREVPGRQNSGRKLQEMAALTPFEIAEQFLGEMDDAEKELLQDVMNSLEVTG